MVTKTCQPGSIYLQTWVHCQTQMPLDTQTTSFWMPDWCPGDWCHRFRGLKAPTVQHLPFWRDVPVPTATTHRSVCSRHICQPTLARDWSTWADCCTYAGSASCWQCVDNFTNSWNCNTEKPNLCLNQRSMVYFFGRCFILVTLL